jgi:hypothetical protein
VAQGDDVQRIDGSAHRGSVKVVRLSQA